MVLNPHTFRCISGRGRIARELARAGDIDEGELRAGPPKGRDRERMQERWRQRNLRVTRKNRRSEAPVLFGVEPDSPLVPFAQPFAQQQQKPLQQPCRDGFERNPATGRCIRVGGRTFKRVHPTDIPGLGMIEPLGAALVPRVDRRTALSWITTNCNNAVDPLTGQPFHSAAPSTLQEVLRLHDGTCSTATALRGYLMEKRGGRRPTIPGSPDVPINAEDVRVLQAALQSRRIHPNPDAPLPPPRWKPSHLPSTWKLYVAADLRSGPDFASVAYVDVTKGKRTPYGVSYPLDSFRIDLGFIPATGAASGSCSIQTIVELLGRLAEANKLLVPAPGGWRPVAGFPFTKEHWQDSYRPQKLGKLCRDLARALTS